MNKTALRWVLGISFFFIMLVSVTHVAWAAHEMEGGNSDTSWWDWIMSYIFALAIDVAIASISLFLTTKKGWGYKIIGYSFVVGLTMLSWFANWTYNKSHMVTSGVWAGSIHVADHQVNMAWLAPIAFGALPVIGIAFSVMIDFFTAEKVTADELEAMYAEQEKITQLKEKYTKKGALKDKLKSLVDDAAEVTNYTKKAASTIVIGEHKGDPNEPLMDKEIPTQVTQVLGLNEQAIAKELPTNMDPIEAINPESMSKELPQNIQGQGQQLGKELAPLPERNTGPIGALKSELMSNEGEDETEDQYPQFSEEKSTDSDLWSGLSPRGSVSVEDAAKALNITTKYAMRLLKEGKLKPVGKSKNRVSVASLKAYSEKQSKRNQSLADFTINLESMSIELSQNTEHIEPLNEQPISEDVPTNTDLIEAINPESMSNEGEDETEAFITTTEQDIVLFEEAAMTILEEVLGQK